MKTPMTFKKFLVTAAIVLPAASQAGVFHNITSVTSTTSATDLFIVDNLIEGSGVGFDVNPPHDRTSGSTWVTNAPNGGVADYFDPLPDPAPVFVFDLGADVELQEISVWGYSDTNGNGAKQFSLRFATEAEGTTGFGTSITYNPTFAATLPATPRQSSLFPDMVTARYVELTPEDNFFEDLTGGDRVGLGEVAFEILSVAAEPNIEVQDSFNFPTSSFIQAANIQVRNLGAQDLTVSGTNWTGPNAEAFSTLALPATLAELESGNVEIQLDPAGQTPGSISATLQIMSNDPDTPTAKIAVTSTIPAAGASFYPIASVESDTAGGDLWPAENLIQGPGEGFNADPPHDQLGGGDTHRWVTNAPGGYPSDYIEAGGTPIITLDLGEDRPLSEISVWGYTATNSNGLSEFSLRFATNSDGPDGFGTSITYNPTFGGPPPDGMEIDDIPRQSFSFEETAFARYVEFTCVDNWFTAPGDGTGGVVPGGDRVGFGEIAFAIVDPISSTPFAITDIVFDGTEVTLTFNSRPGVSYTAWRSDNMAPDTWAEMDDNVSSQGDVTVFVDKTLPQEPVPNRVFYRISVTE
jgi:hypothetical protein